MGVNAGLATGQQTLFDPQVWHQAFSTVHASMSAAQSHRQLPEKQTTENARGCNLETLGTPTRATL